MWCVLIATASERRTVPELHDVLLRRARGLRDEVRRHEAGEQLLTHVPTGFTAIDDMFGGIRLGCATEIMAHTGDGKSALAKQLCEAGAKAGAGVAWFVGEDPEDATAERVLADGTGIPATDIGRLDLSAAELDRIDSAAAATKSWAQRIDVRFGPLDVDDLMTQIGELEEVGGAPLRLVVVDYIQMMAASRALEDDIARLATHLNASAAARRIAVVLMSQVASDVLRRGRDFYSAQKQVTGFIPGLGDTEWCRRAEKSTKAVWALFRPGRWKREMGEDADDDCAELHVRKANFGPTGWVPLRWDGKACRFDNA